MLIVGLVISGITIAIVFNTNMGAENSMWTVMLFELFISTFSLFFKGYRGLGAGIFLGYGLALLILAMICGGLILVK